MFAECARSSQLIRRALGAQRSLRGRTAPAGRGPVERRFRLCNPACSRLDYANLACPSAATRRVDSLIRLCYAPPER